MNIIETVQKNLGFSALEKIDPNTQETAGEKNAIGTTALAQAGIPAILLGIYNRLEIRSGHFLSGTDAKGNVLENIFGKSTDAVVKRISEYSKIDDKHSLQELEHIASESMRVVKANIGEGASESAVRNFVSKNKPDILLYLPPSLELGTILKNNNLDDRTGKMEGPVSSFMQNCGKDFQYNQYPNLSFWDSAFRAGVWFDPGLFFLKILSIHSPAFSFIFSAFFETSPAIPH